MFLLFYVSMVVLCIFGFTTWAKYEDKWDEWNFDFIVMLVYLPSILWPVSLAVIFIYFLGVMINKIFDSWTTSLAKILRKYK